MSMGGGISHLSSERVLNQNKRSLLDSTETSNLDLQGSTMSLNNFEGSSSGSVVPSFSGPPSLLRIKEEASGSSLDLNDVGTSSSTSHARLTKPGNSYPAQQTLSEHVVIPTDPSFMQGIQIKITSTQLENTSIYYYIISHPFSFCTFLTISIFSGLDSGSIEQESLSEQTSVNQGFNPQMSSGGLQHQNKLDQQPPVSSSSSSSNSGRDQNQAVIGGKPKPCPIAQCASKGSVHRHIRYNAFFV